MNTNEGNLAIKIQRDLHRKGYRDKYRRIFGRSQPPMRMKKSAVRKGITVLNDSGATCADATYYSLRKIQQSLQWIVWNDDVETAFEQWDAALLQHVRRIIAIGKTYDKLRYLFGDIIEVSRAATPEEALASAWENGRRGEKILISHATPQVNGMTAEEVFGLFEKIIKQTTRR